jgi:Membrane-associating domain
MPVPSYGAAPLSTTFIAVRGMQVLSMIIILGLTANFINEMVMANYEPSREIVGTITITSIATLYTLVSIAFYWSIANLGLYVMGGVDALLCIAWIVVSTSVGKPVSYMNCYHPLYATDGIDPATGMILPEILANLNKGGLKVWSGLSKSNCFETKAIWGFSIALAVLYATSAILLPTLRYKHMKVGGYAKTAV